MIRLQVRDWNLLEGLGYCELMSYSQIRNNYFKSYFSCAKRIGKLQKDNFIKGSYYNTDEKIFTLQKDGVDILANVKNLNFKIGEYNQIYHKLMRTELFLKFRKYSIKNYTNEAKIQEISRIFDASFDYNGKLYLVEIHNAQKSKILNEKLIDCLKLQFPFTVIIYCKNKDVVKHLIEKMNKKGFSDKRQYAIKIFESGDDIVI